MLDLTSPVFNGGSSAGADVGAFAGQPDGGDRTEVPTSGPRCSARTTVVTLLAGREAVFKLLADIENLPRWAPGFCESVSIVEGRWVALTSCGELYLALETNDSAGEIVLSAGWNPEELDRFTLAVKNDEQGRARVRFPLTEPVSVERGQIYSRLEIELHELTGRLELIERSA